MSEGGLNLRKWTSNSSELLQQIKQAELSHADDCSSTTTSVSEEEQTFAQGYLAQLGPCHTISYWASCGIVKQTSF